MRETSYWIKVYYRLTTPAVLGSAWTSLLRRGRVGQVFLLPPALPGTHHHHHTLIHHDDHLRHHQHQHHNSMIKALTLSVCLTS